jgi:hypothetical protein
MKVTRRSGRADVLGRLASREAPRAFALANGEHDLALRPSGQMVSLSPNASFECQRQGAGPPPSDRGRRPAPA